MSDPVAPRPPLVPRPGDLAHLEDLLRLSGSAIVAHRLRSALTMLGIVVGIASVILLTSIGEGARVYLLSEFTQFGTNLLSVTPGRVKTTGMPGTVATTIRKLTVEDAEALLRVPGVEKVVPVAFGNARIAWGDRGRSVFVYGVNSEVPAVWKFAVGRGRFLPEAEVSRAAPLAVLGPKLARELFGDASPLGQRIRVAGSRFVVVGVLAPKGQFLGFDIDDAAYIPVASAQNLFGREELIEIDVLFSPHVPVHSVQEGIRRVLMARHDDAEDFTIITQGEMLDVLDRILTIVSVAIGGIGAISLLVGAIGILTMMWIAVSERTAEIGLAKALGATAAQVSIVFLAEAALLSVSGGVLGVATGMGVGALIRVAVPGLPLSTPPEFVAAALAVSLAVGLVSGVLPARRAAGLDPIEALRAE